jgi:hypothetical protein
MVRQVSPDVRLLRDNNKQLRRFANMDNRTARIVRTLESMENILALKEEDIGLTPDEFRTWNDITNIIEDLKGGN